MKLQRHIEQSRVFEIIGVPKSYDGLDGWQKHNLRHNARLKYDRERNAGSNPKWAAFLALEDATRSAEFYALQNRDAELNRRCGARAKSTGQPCRMKPVKGKRRCKYHGGMSTGPKTLLGRIKAISSLKQYNARPDLLQARIARLETEWMNSPDYAPQGYVVGERLPADL